MVFGFTATYVIVAYRHQSSVVRVLYPTMARCSWYKLML